MARKVKGDEPVVEQDQANRPFGGTPMGMGDPGTESGGSIDLDFTGTEDKDFTIPAGFWPAVVISVKTTPTKKGDKQLEFTFKITEKGDNYGKTCKAWIVLLPQCMWKVQQFLKALGVATTGKVNIDPKELTGKACRMQITYDQNRDRSEVKKLIQADADDIELALNVMNDMNGIPS